MTVPISVYYGPFRDNHNPDWPPNPPPKPASPAAAPLATVRVGSKWRSPNDANAKARTDDPYYPLGSPTGIYPLDVLEGPYDSWEYDSEAFEGHHIQKYVVRYFDGRIEMLTQHTFDTYLEEVGSRRRPSMGYEGE